MTTQRIKPDQIDPGTGNAGKALVVSLDGLSLTYSAVSGTGGAVSGTAVSGIFRGPWATDQLAYSYAFQDQTIASPFTTTGSSATVPVTATVASLGRPSAPGFTYAASVKLANSGPSTAVLTWSLASLGLTNVTRVRWWQAGDTDGGNGASAFKTIVKNGSTSLLNTNAAFGWTQVDYAAAASDVYVFSISVPNNSGVYAPFYVTGFEVYNTPAPYMLNDVVTYKGVLYQSAANYNASTPGANADWNVLIDPAEYKGAWSSGLTYQAGDIVTRNGRGFVATAAHTANDYDPAGSVGVLGSVTQNGGADGFALEAAVAFTVSVTTSVSHVRFKSRGTIAAGMQVGIASDFSNTATVPWLGKYTATGSMATETIHTVALDQPVLLVAGTTYRWTFDPVDGNSYIYAYNTTAASGIINTIGTRLNGTTFNGTDSYKPGFDLLSTVPGTNWDALSPDAATLVADHAANTNPHPIYLTQTEGDARYVVGVTAAPATYIAYSAVDSSSGSWSHTFPTHVTGDWAVLGLKAGEGGAVTTPTGWTKLGEAGTTGTATSRMGVYVRQFDGTEGTSVSLTAAGPGVAYYGSIISVWRGFTATPVLLDISGASADNATPSVNASAYDKVLYLAARWDNTAAVTPPAGIVNLGDGTGHIMAYEAGGVTTSAHTFTGATVNASIGLGTFSNTHIVKYQGAWSSSIVYETNDLVTRGNQGFVATAPHGANDYDPLVATTNWDPLGDSVKPVYGKRSGTLTVQAGTARWYNDTGRTLTITAVRATVETSPTGSTVIVDVNKNGTTIFTTQSNRPAIAISGVTAKVTTIEVSSWADGEYLTFDVDQIGSTVPGADLTVQVVAR